MNFTFQIICQQTIAEITELECENKSTTEQKFVLFFAGNNLVEQNLGNISQIRISDVSGILYKESLVSDKSKKRADTE